jgi:transglutaminase-like putative cysteine protease
MSQSRAYRQMIALLLLWSLVPLPFSGIVMLPFWLVAAGAAIYLWRRPVVRFSPALQNLTGLLILIVVALTRGIEVGPLRPLGHLLVLLTAVRCLQVEDRRTFLRALPAVALVWVVSVTTSTHASLMVYLLVSIMIIWWSGMQILLLGLPQPKGSVAVARLTGPRPLHAIVGGVLSLLVAVPIFLVMPRMQSPWIAIGGGSRAVSGFSSAIELARVGEIQQSRETAMIVKLIGEGRLLGRWTRLRATAFDLVRTGMWTPRRNPLQRPEVSDGKTWLREDRSLSDTTELRIELFKPGRYLFLPEGTVAMSCPVPVVIDPAGGIMIGRRRVSAPLVYSVWVTSSPGISDEAPTTRDVFLPNLNQTVRQIAFDLASEQPSDELKAVTVASHLQESYSFSLTATSRLTENDPVEWFLTEGRAGHCELFAGTMVVLLRHLEVPARMVGGYLGGTVAPSGTEVIVGQNNAHAWVEVWLGQDRGWVAFDPTPVEGIPELGELSGVNRLRWLWDQLQIIWDRYVLTFGASEQVNLVVETWTWLADAAKRLQPRHLLWLLVLPGAWGAWKSLQEAVKLWRRRRRRTPAARALARLARRLDRAGMAVPPGTTLRRLGALATTRWPEAKSAVAELVALAEQELYAPGIGLAAPAGTVRRLWSRTRRATM